MDSYKIIIDEESYRNEGKINDQKHDRFWTF